MSERQELLAALLESKKSLQKDALEKFHEKIFQELKELEEQKSKGALELLEHKHRLDNKTKKRSMPDL